ncbi:MAG: hypothetical protein HUJ56_05050 [Erysipelotrichaceae bacterium]|nr:hypothetical protein [Erysipelotrichaceae bacterium]
MKRLVLILTMVVGLVAGAFGEAKLIGPNTTITYYGDGWTSSGASYKVINDILALEHDCESKVSLIDDDFDYDWLIVGQIHSQYEVKAGDLYSVDNIGKADDWKCMYVYFYNDLDDCDIWEIAITTPQIK